MNHSYLTDAAMYAAVLAEVRIDLAAANAEIKYLKSLLANPDRDDIREGQLDAAFGRAHSFV